METRPSDLQGREERIEPESEEQLPTRSVPKHI